MRTTSRLAVLGALLSATVGCGASPGPAEPSARATAVRFAEAVGDDDHALACSLLAPETRAQLEQSAGKPCGVALAEEDLAAADALEEVATFGTMTQVRFAGDTVFLAEFPQGWKVFAAGCTPVPDRPYDCRLQGG